MLLWVLLALVGGGLGYWLACRNDRIEKGLAILAGLIVGILVGEILVLSLVRTKDCQTSDLTMRQVKRLPMSDFVCLPPPVQNADVSVQTGQPLRICFYGQDIATGKISIYTPVLEIVEFASPNQPSKQGIADVYERASTVRRTTRSYSGAIGFLLRMPSWVVGSDSIEETTVMEKVVIWP